MNEHSAFWLAGDNRTGKSQNSVVVRLFSLKQTFNGFTFNNPVLADSFQHILGSQKDFMEDFSQFSSKSTLLGKSKPFTPTMQYLRPCSLTECFACLIAFLLNSSGNS